VEVVVVVLVSGSRVVVPRVEVVGVMSVVDVVTDVLLVDVVIDVVVVDAATDVVVVDVVLATVVVVVAEVVDVVASSPNTMAQLLPAHHLPEPSATSC
jgi:hypothetical protein